MKSLLLLCVERIFNYWFWRRILKYCFVFFYFFEWRDFEENISVVVVFLFVLCFEEVCGRVWEMGVCWSGVGEFCLMLRELFFCGFGGDCCEGGFWRFVVVLFGGCKWWFEVCVVFVWMLELCGGWCEVLIWFCFLRFLFGEYRGGGSNWVG